jgi:hypothetical protein
VAGVVLNANYAERTLQRESVLRKDMSENGLCFMGDGATVSKTPLLNLLASKGNSGLFLLGMIDCSVALAEVGTKSFCASAAWKYRCGHFGCTCTVATRSRSHRQAANSQPTASSQQPAAIFEI